MICNYLDLWLLFDFFYGTIGFGYESRPLVHQMTNSNRVKEKDLRIFFDYSQIKYS